MKNKVVCRVNKSVSFLNGNKDFLEVLPEDFTLTAYGLYWDRMTTHSCKGVYENSIFFCSEMGITLFS